MANIAIDRIHATLGTRLLTLNARVPARVRIPITGIEANISRTSTAPGAV